MVLPNFLIFGVQKAGTTSVYSYLQQHPQVFMSPRKETEFLGRDPAQIDSSSDKPLLTPGGRAQIVTLEAYKALFEGVTNEVAIGEASPNYLFRHERAVPAIQKYVPKAKLVAILRNPVERAYSDYLMHVRQVVGNQKPLAEQIETSAESSFTLLKGRYFAGMKHFLETFGPQQVKVFLYEDLKGDAPGLMRDLYRFIGVDPEFAVDTGQRQQTAAVPKNQSVNRLLRTDNPVRSAVGTLLRTVMPEEKRQALRSRLIAANSAGKEAMPLSDQDCQRLKAYYREDVLKLQDLINRDLSAWL
ncbi:sulfotransferase [cf. Phormidesmis sp. LEGE 11477]|uniref:sulfotransferase family protein n=1 Tax=cf. Phormidesmis sp. LEGE 11477 TaxID=1828680 RepID=UPI0018812D1A|nr:sulfotransferase [cf. Phormidesmis sp. LEGE 11477]MBE9060459.1 sulfotransferase [cf. Phormidesmis sp. LEGE 11477]